MSAVRPATPIGDQRERRRIAQLEPESRRDRGERPDHPLDVREQRADVLARLVVQVVVLDQRGVDHECADRLAQRVDEPTDLIGPRGPGGRHQSGSYDARCARNREKAHEPKKTLNLRFGAGDLDKLQKPLGDLDRASARSTC